MTPTNRFSRFATAGTWFCLFYGSFDWIFFLHFSPFKILFYKLIYEKTHSSNGFFFSVPRKVFIPKIVCLGIKISFKNAKNPVGLRVPLFLLCVNSYVLASKDSWLFLSLVASVSINAVSRCSHQGHANVKCLSRHSRLLAGSARLLRPPYLLIRDMRDSQQSMVILLTRVPATSLQAWMMAMMWTADRKSFSRVDRRWIQF
jgi:hypothetical protein